MAITFFFYYSVVDRASIASTPLVVSIHPKANISLWNMKKTAACTCRANIWRISANIRRPSLFFHCTVLIYLFLSFPYHFFFSVSPTRASSLHLPPYLCSHSVLLPHFSFAIPLSLSCSSIQHAAVLTPSASYERCSFSPRFQCAHTDTRACNLATSMGKRLI